MSRRLTLEDERQMLTEIRGWQAIDNDEYERLLGERMGIAWLDQFKAARDEATTALQKVRGRTPLRHMAFARPTVLAPMLTAGVLRCLAASHCEHALRGDRPLFAALAARVIACEQCLPRYRGALVANDLRVLAGDDQLCDFCLEERDWFFPTSIAYGPVVLFGDMCQPCQEQAKDGGQ